MRSQLTVLFVLGIILAMLGGGVLTAAAPDSAGSAPDQDSWQVKLAEELPELGHRNWIIVADSAYPASSSESIEITYIGGDLTKAVQTVLDLVDQAKHVRPVVYIDAELRHLSEKDCPGITAHRRQVEGQLKGRPVHELLHEDLLVKVDKAAEMYRVLVLKTDMILPYTTVHVELDCGYWSAAAEQRLRDAMK